MENDLIDNFNFVESFHFSPKKWTPDQGVHAFVALLANGVLDADAVDHLALWWNHGGRSRRLFLLLTQPELEWANLAFIGYLILVIPMERVLVLPK
jgi:hypothetical protein